MIISLIPFQIILNSGRLVFNTTEDHLLLSSAKSISLSSTGTVNIDASEMTIHKLVRSFNSFGILRLNLRLFLRLVFRLSPNFVRDFHRKYFQLKTANKQISNLDDFLNCPPELVN